MKRVFLFVATNLAVLLVLGIVLSILMPVLGLDSQSNAGLLFLCAVFGMGGSLISLAMSKWIAKRSVGAYVIENPRNRDEQWLVDTVRQQAQAAGIGMPEVAIYDSPEINAFATGANRNNALAARHRRPSLNRRSGRSTAIARRRHRFPLVPRHLEPGRLGLLDLGQSLLGRVAESGARLEIRHVRDVAAVFVAVEDINVVVLHRRFSNLRSYRSTSRRSGRI